MPWRTGAGDGRGRCSHHFAFGRAGPLSAITTTIRQVADGADHVEVPHVGRSDEIGALARAIQIFQEAMARNRSLNSQVLADAEASEARARRREAAVEMFRDAMTGVVRAVNANASTMRQTAQSIAKVASDANGQAAIRFQRHRAGIA